MTISKPVHGSSGWDDNVNDVIDAVNALTDGAVALQFNVKNYGATGDGVTDDAAACQSAISAASAAGGGTVYFPAGTYMLSSSLNMADLVYLLGEGMGATTLKKNTDFNLLQFYGAAAGADNHILFSGAAGMTLHGNDHTGTCIDMVYASLLTFRDIHCSNNLARTIDTVEVYDSRFYNMSLDNCGSATAEAVRIGASRAASGFGSSSDGTNELAFFGLRVETWDKGAILIDPGLAGLVQQIHMFALKVETVQVGGNAITVSGAAFDIHMDDLWIYMGDFAGGFSTASIGLALHGGLTTVRGLHISNGGVATISSGVDIDGDNNNIDAMHGTYSTAPTVAHVKITGGAGTRIGHCTTAAGTLFSGTVTTALTDQATIATDANLGSQFRVTLGGNRTLGAPTNPKDGQTCTWEFIQDGTGSRTLSLNAVFALGTTVTSTTLTTTAAKRDFLTAVYNSTANKWYVTSFVKGY